MLLQSASLAVLLVSLFSGFSTSLVLVALLCILWYCSQKFSKSDTPPGPVGLPVIGYLPFIGKQVHLSFDQLRKKYGDVFSVQLGQQNFVVLSSYKLIREAFSEKGDVFSGRPPAFSSVVFKNGEQDIITSDKLVWKETRKFTVVEMKKFGFGTSSIQLKIQDEIGHFLNVLEEQRGNAFDLQTHLSRTICNNICIFCFGERFQYDDTRFQLLCKELTDFGRTHQVADLYQFFPKFFETFPIAEHFFTSTAVIRGIVHRVLAMFEEDIKEHRESHSVGSERDFIDNYISEMSEQQKDNSKMKLFTDKNLTVSISNMVFAGLDTTTNTLLWTFVHLISHPDIQDKIHKEIDTVIGRDRMPCFEDKTMMPYTEAVLLETMRMYPVVVLNLPHRAREDAMCGGYRIPKDTTVICNLWSIHYDEIVFPDPASFRPERFIDEQGQLVRPSNVIPFSIGKRVCIGESLARTEMFLYLTSMLQRFTFVNPENQTINTEVEFRTVISPKPYLIKAIKREA